MTAKAVSGAAAVSTVEKPKALEHVKRINPKTDKFEVSTGKFDLHTYTVGYAMDDLTEFSPCTGHQVPPHRLVVC